MVCAQTQVVADTHYRLGLDVADARWRVVVYENPDGVLELTESEVQ